jgi:hypothetical protein
MLSTLAGGLAASTSKEAGRVGAISSVGMGAPFSVAAMTDPYCDNT